MFGFFDDPFDYMYRPRYYRYGTRPSMFDRYLSRLLARDLLYGFDDSDDGEPEREQERERESEKKEEDEEKKSEKKEEKKVEGNHKGRSYFYESRSSRRGNDFVEEHRERVEDEDGVHVTTRRRLGDRWYENEMHTDKEGKQWSKETWHNVPEDQIERFKAEWTEKHSLQHRSTTPALESSEAESKKE